MTIRASKLAFLGGGALDFGFQALNDRRGTLAVRQVWNLWDRKDAMDQPGARPVKTLKEAKGDLIGMISYTLPRRCFCLYFNSKTCNQAKYTPAYSQGFYLIKKGFFL